jgi:hypothetical protein
MFTKKAMIAAAIGAVAVYVFMNKDKFFKKPNGSGANGGATDVNAE